MGTRSKVVAIAIVTGLLVSLVPLAAQTSNTSAATAGQFKTETDKFMSVVDWSAIKESIFMGGSTDSSRVEGGLGFKVGSALYLGAYYRGYMLQDPNTPTQKFSKNTTLILNNNTVIGQTIDERKWTDGKQAQMDNLGALLVGFGPLGIKLGAYQDSNLTEDQFQIENFHANYTPANNNPNNPSLNTASFNTDTSGINLINFINNTYSDNNQNYPWLANSGNDTVKTTFSAGLTTPVAKETVSYTNGLKGTTTLIPYMDLGANLDLGMLVFKPRLSANMAFRTDTLAQTYNKKTQAIGSAYPTKDSVTEVSYAQSRTMNQAKNKTDVNANVDLAFEMPVEKNKIKFKVNYALYMPLYSSAYKKSSGDSATVDGEGSDYAENTYTYNLANTMTTDIKAHEIKTYSGHLKHTITPGAGYVSALSDTLSLSGYLTVPVVMESYATTVSGSVITKETYTDNVEATNNTTRTVTKSYTGDTYDYSYFSVYPYVSLGLQFMAVKDVLTFNVGSTINVPGVMNEVKKTTKPGLTTVTDVKTKADGTVVDDKYDSTLGWGRYESQNVVTDWRGFGTSVSAGMNFKMGSGVSLDLSSNISGNTINASSFTAQIQISK